MPHFFGRVAAWITRQLFPPAGRHRQRPLPRVMLVPNPVKVPAVSALCAGRAAPHWNLLHAEETALVRPYVLAAESRRLRGPGLTATP